MRADERPKAEIEIASEMISAGSLELPPLISPRDDMEDAVIRIFRAMVKAASTPPGL
jgi:hypothetical protein